MKAMVLAFWLMMILEMFIHLTIPDIMNHNVALIFSQLIVLSFLFIFLSARSAQLNLFR